MLGLVGDNGAGEGLRVRGCGSIALSAFAWAVTVVCDAPGDSFMVELLSPGVGMVCTAQTKKGQSDRKAVMT